MAHGRELMKGVRNLLWKEDPHCRRCRVRTVLPELILGQYPAYKNCPGELKNRMATLQHIYQKGHPRRGRGPKGNPVTLYCYRCNQIDSREFALRSKIGADIVNPASPDNAGEPDATSHA